ncbi:hypothetical protein APHAL10511_008593 [Amanita phalloides]|nr:hypothetical protein APHAL10511_008593 [Amanita phalloides]
MATKYKVEYIQVNINVGDCEIILLLEEDKDGGKDRIKYAVLVDGGMGHPIPLKNIKETFKKIAGRLDRKYRRLYPFKLDAIVITHWDKDHYEGILKFLNNGFYDKGETVLKQWGKLTRLYVPYTPHNLKTFDDDFEVDNGELKSIRDGKTETTKTTICKYIADMPAEDTTLLEGAPVAWNFDEQESQLIGRNLFTDSRPTLDQGNTANPKALVDAHGATVPGLYCVAANNRFLGVVNGSEGGDKSNKNRSSIVCMVIHPDGTVSHYFGGDAHQEIECKIMEWTGFTTLTMQINTVGDNDRIAIVKASHHGSYTATPTTMCQTYKPKYFVFSAGNMYQHPMWEVLLYVAEYYNSLAEDNRVLMTSFPCWMRPGVMHFPPPDLEKLLIPEKDLEDRYEATIKNFWGKELPYLRNLYEWAKGAREDAKKITLTRSIAAGARAEAAKAADAGDASTAEAETAEAKVKEAEAAEAEARKGRAEKNISTMLESILEECSPIGEDNYVLPGTRGKTTSHVSYISFQLDRPEPVEIERIGPKFKSLSKKRHCAVTSSLSDTVKYVPTKKLKSELTYKIVRPPMFMLSMAATSKAENDTDKKYYLMSSLVQSSSGHCVYVPAQWNPFVSALSYGFIILADELTSASQIVVLDKADEWQVWLSSAISPSDPSLVQLSVTGSVADVKLTIDHFRLTITVPGPSTLTFGPSRKVGPKDDPTLQPITDFLRFDLADSSVGSTISFGDLVKFFDAGCDSIVFDSNISLELDKSSTVWFSPLVGSYTSTLRLQATAKFDSSKAPDTVSFLKSLSNLGLWDDIIPLSVTVVAKKTTTTLSFASPKENISEPELILCFDFPLFSARISCATNSYTLAIYWKSGVLDAVVKLLDNIGGSTDASKEFKEVLESISSTFDILRVLVEINCSDKGSKPSLGKIGVDTELKFKINKKSSETKDVAFMLSFVWPNFIFTGSLYVPDKDESRKLIPSYEELFDVKPTIETSNDFSLLDLIPGVAISEPPEGIPTIISRAEIEVDSTSFMLEGVLTAEPPSPGTALPSVSFDKLELYLSYDWSSKALSLYIAALINLHPLPAGGTDSRPAPDCMSDPGFLFSTIEYADQKWTLTGHLNDINFGDLALFFNEDERGQLVDVLGNVTIRSVYANCEYGNGEPFKFQFMGSIEIAALELDFAYNRDSSGWSIEGGLSAANECTLGAVVRSICGGESTDFDIPGFISDVKLNVKHDPASQLAPKDSPVYLRCSKASSNDSPLVLVFRLTLDKFQFSFIQISSKQSGKKRALVFSIVNILPSFTIPVIGQVGNPVDGLEFVWVQDKSKTPGLTRAEVADINSTAFAPQTGIVFKESKPSEGAAMTDIVLTVGCHFMLLTKDSGKVTAVLDYRFVSPKSKSKGDTKSEPEGDGTLKSAQSASADSGGGSGGVSGGGGGGGGVSKAAVHKIFGPLSLSNIGLQYKDSKITIVLDATLTLGPIGLTLLGFGLGLKLSSTLFSDFKPADLSLQLQGFGAASDKPPILLAGLLEHITADHMDLYAGGIAVNFKAYSFLALASYGPVTYGSEEFKTFFLFAQLSGPLVELEFATINGVSLGFGYNSHVKYPNVDEILSFPLVKGVSTGSTDASASTSNVLTILSDDVFTKWVTPQNDSFWFAVGLEALAFHVLDVRAVAIIEINPDISIGLFADAVLSLPPKLPRERSYVYVELGIASCVDVRNGAFSAEGRLSPNSFILDPSCHLLGGFALYYWFDPSPYAGDFVFTIGGYHPAYQPPSHYPRPQRLTISWQLDSNLSITGESFFAITPKVCMGGGSLSVLFQLGGLRAHLNAHALFLMVWSPFHFMGDIGVSVGVGYRGRFLFWTYNIEIDIFASLHLEGPPFGGNVHIGFWLFGFDIYFGSHPGPPPPLSLDEFWDLLSRSSNQPNSGHDAGITLVVESGYAQGKSSQVTPKSGEPWIVTAGQFKFNAQCRFALRNVKYKSGSDWTDVCASPIPPNVYSKPMHTTKPVESILKIKILDKETSQDVGGFTFLPLTKNVPSAMWGQYDSNNDPSHGHTPGDLLDSNNSTVKDMLTGIHVIAPKAKYPDDHILPFNAHDAMFVEILKGGGFPVVNPSREANAWLPKTASWNGAKQAWSGPAETCKVAVREWANVFGWVGKFIGKPPTVLVDNLDKVYLYIPEITSS